MPDGTAYECDWRDDKQSAHGFTTYPDGTRIEGEFIEGLFVAGWNPFEGESGL